MDWKPVIEPRIIDALCRNRVQPQEVKAYHESPPLPPPPQPVEKIEMKSIWNRICDYIENAYDGIKKACDVIVPMAVAVTGLIHAISRFLSRRSKRCTCAA